MSFWEGVVFDKRAKNKTANDANTSILLFVPCQARIQEFSKGDEKSFAYNYSTPDKLNFLDQTTVSSASNITLALQKEKLKR